MASNSEEGAQSDSADDLRFIARRIRKLADTEVDDFKFLEAVWQLVRKSIELGAFASVRFTELTPFFDPLRDTETYDTVRSLTGAPVAAPKPIRKLPLTMLNAMKWLAENGNDIGLSVPTSLPGLEKLERIQIRGFVHCRIQCPNRDQLRPHVEFLASLIEGIPLKGQRNATVKLVTIKQVAELLAHLQPSSMTSYVKEWGDPVVPQSGTRSAQFDLSQVRPILKRQFPLAKEADWQKVEASATPA